MPLLSERDDARLASRSERRAAGQVACIRARNRRLEYLRRHPGFVTSSEREFADVALYHRWVRLFQTPTERIAEARDKGFGQVLEASILRNPEPLARAAGEAAGEPAGEPAGETGAEGTQGESGGERRLSRSSQSSSVLADELHFELEATGPDAGSLSPRDAALRRWHAFVRDWFVRGGAAVEGFDYAAVDEDSEYDDGWTRAAVEAAWFDDESPGWASEEDERDERDEGEEGEEGEKRQGHARTGETGVQDY